MPDALGMAANEITYSQIEALTEGLDWAMARMVERTCLAINDAESTIASRLADMTRIMERVQDALSAGQSLNGSGELGRYPAEFDQAIVARQIHWQTLGMLVGIEKTQKLATSRA
jgi:hypothetical protein